VAYCVDGVSNVVTEDLLVNNNNLDGLIIILLLRVIAN
jgi:hypothetical protein